MIRAVKKTVQSGHVRETRLVRVSVCGLLVGRDRVDRKALEQRKRARHSAYDKAKNALIADQHALLERMAADAGMSVPLFRAKLLLESR